MPASSQGIGNVTINFLRFYTYSFNQLPRKTAFQEKLGLFAFLAGLPIRRLYRCPVNFLQLCKIFAILKVICSGIRERKDPASAVLVRPGCHGMQIGLQMDNRALPAPRMISASHHRYLSLMIDGNRSTCAI